MTSTAAVSAIRSAIGCEFIPAKVFDTCSAMPALTKDPDLVYEICLLQKVLFLLVYKDIVPVPNHRNESSC